MGKFYESLGDGLVLLVRTLAWLNATPEDPPQGKGPVRRKAPGDRKTRLQLLQEKGSEPDLPEVGDEIYLVTYLMEVGPITSSGMGVDRVSFQELESWQRQVGITLQPWELLLLRRLSGEYAGEAHRATAHDAPPPSLPKLSADQRAAVGKSLQSSLRARALPRTTP